MKARMCRVYNNEDLGMKPDSVRIVKSGSRDGEEMQQCFSKLASIVPTVHQDQKVSKVQLLQHVIDYITDLEITLQYKPTYAGLYHIADTRRPLCENTYLNTMTSHMSSMQLAECDVTTTTTTTS